MNIGFTGTRRGITEAQRAQLSFLLAALKCPCNFSGTPVLHYGTHDIARLLADEEAAEIAEALGYKLVPHHAKVGEELKRNDEIADICDLLIATPETDYEEVRSGTWATVRRARKREKTVAQLAVGRAQRRLWK